MQKKIELSQLRFSTGIKVITLMSALVFSFLAVASDLAIRTHLKDATKINIARAPLYAQLTNDQSLKLSYELIFMENIAKAATLPLDLKAKKYVDKGIRLFHDDLIDMNETPSFSSSFKEGEVPVERVSIEVKDLRKRWLESVKNKDLDSIYHEALYLLDEGELKSKNQNCLTRHFVESIARSIFNHESHREEALKAGLPDPQNLLISFLKIHIHTLGWTKSLDRRAFDIQKNNVPLFCQDVPAIEYK